MASIINEMLRMAGITSYLTWIGSRDIPYTYVDVPTPSVDNHMITSYKDSTGNWCFLDGTGKCAPLELYTSFIQGKQGLISINPDSFLLVTVPIKDTSVSQTIDSVNITISGNQLYGKGRASLSGYDRLDYIYDLESLNKPEREEFFKGYFSKGNNKVSFSDVAESHSDRSIPLSVSYSFNVPDYVRRVQDEIYINLNLNSGWNLEQIPETRNVPLSFKHITKKKSITTLIIPEGYKPEFIPGNSSLENEAIGYKSTYTLTGNTITHTYDFYINTLLLGVTGFSQYNNVLNEQTKDTKQSVSLIKL